MNRSVAVICAFVGFMSANQAHAQEVMSPVATELSIGESVDQRNDRRAMARCIADYYPSTVQLVMRRQDTSLDLKNGKHTLLDVNCLKPKFFRSRTATINSEYFSYMAEFLLVSDYDNSKLPDFSHVGPLYHPFLPDMEPTNLPAHYRYEFAVDRWHYALDVVAECVARTAPERAFALATTKMDSEQETSEVARLSVPLESCKAATVTPAPPNFALRAALSEALYRLVDAASPVVHKKPPPVTVVSRRP